jgi:hypothetical protein
MISAAAFAAAFGFVEAAVVVYLRAATGLLPGYQGTLSQVAHLARQGYQQAQAVNGLPSSLQTVEVIREGATMVILVAVALLSDRGARQRWAVFLWAFAIWDISYYVSLWATVGWPFSLTNTDVLFLIPQPWLAQVWFPILVSTATLMAIVAVRRTD